MAGTKKVKFLRPVGYGMVRFSTGAVADLPEVWADRFIANGTAVAAPAEKGDTGTKAKPAKKKK